MGLLASTSGIAVTAGGLALATGYGAVTTVQSFDVVNFDGASTSAGFIRVGLPFKYGDMPSGSIPKIEKSGVEVTAVQFDERAFWPDGSLRFCVLHMRDSAFSASESRTYDVKIKSGSYSNTATFASTAITGTYDLKAQITSLTQPNQTNTNNHTASINTAFGTATRVTKIHSGPICDGWVVWQYYNDDSDSIDDAHLKAVWYVDIWNDGSDTDGGYIEFGCKTCLNNWDTASKDRHDYTLTLKNSTTTIETYSTIQHPYHAEWLTVSKGNDNNDGRRHWLSTAPTLSVKPDQAYWISTGLVPPLDTSLSTASATNYSASWTPCANMNHRANIDGTGAYMGRGILPNSDATAFLSQTAAHVRYARVNAHAGLHLPAHFKSTKTRTRASVAADAYNDFSAEGSDEANTIISLTLDPKTSGEYTFTSDGMPAPVHAYRGSVATAPYKDGYVDPTGGTGVWNTSLDSSHAVNYSYFMYLLEGERYFLDATIDLTMDAIQKTHGNEYSARPYTLNYLDTYRRALFSIPSTRWSGISLYSSQSRSVGWAANLLGSAYAIMPDNDVQANCLKALVEHNADFAADGISYLPTAQKDWGHFWYGTLMSPWMQNFVTMGAIHLHNCTKDADAKTLADMVCNFPVRIWSTSHYGQTTAYRGLTTEYPDYWHETTNTFRTGDDYLVYYAGASTTSATDVVTITGHTLAVGDKVVFIAEDTSGNAKIIPGGITQGTDYYVINVVADTFQVSLTLGGSAVDITTDETNAYIATRQADYLTNPASSMTGDSYSPIARAALVAANKYGYTSATNTLVTNAQNYTQNEDNSSWYTWSYA